DLAMVDEYRREALGNVHLDGPSLLDPRQAKLAQCVGYDIVQIEHVELWASNFGFQTRDCEEVRDQAIEPAGAFLDILCQLHGARWQCHRAQGPGRAPDCRQWRPQLVRDRPQERRLEPVTLSERTRPGARLRLTLGQLVSLFLQTLELI